LTASQCGQTMWVGSVMLASSVRYDVLIVSGAWR
jgi:hypothetical protein